MKTHESLHESLARIDEGAASSERSFGLVFAGFFAIVAGIRGWNGHADYGWWLAVACGFAVLAIAWPAPLAPLNRLWSRVGRLLHAIVNPLLMGLIFAFAIVPTALLLRVMRRDLLRLRRDPAAPTYWIACDASAMRPGAMKDQF